MLFPVGDNSRRSAAFPDGFRPQNLPVQTASQRVQIPLLALIRRRNGAASSLIVPHHWGNKLALNSPGSWASKQRSSLSICRRDAAAALGWAGEIGELRPGARADAVLLSGDPLAVPVDDLSTIRVRATFAGRWEHRAD
jgi:hypothetical protein